MENNKEKKDDLLEPSKLREMVLEAEKRDAVGEASDVMRTDTEVHRRTVRDILSNFWLERSIADMANEEQRIVDLIKKVTVPSVQLDQLKEEYSQLRTLDQFNEFEIQELGQVLEMIKTKKDLLLELSLELELIQEDRAKLINRFN